MRNDIVQRKIYPLYNFLTILFISIVVSLTYIPYDVAAIEMQKDTGKVQSIDNLVRHFDVTTLERRKFAEKMLDEILYFWLFPYYPEYIAIKYAWKALSPSNIVNKEIEAQRETAIKIIQAGKNNGVDELEITMSEKAGIGLNSNIEDLPIEFLIGNSGNIILKVKYKT